MLPQRSRADAAPSPPSCAALLPAAAPSLDDLETVDRSGLEVLARADCLQLLSTATLARIGITVGALPVVLPVNFRLVGERVVFRVGAGTRLDLGTRDTVVAFEADHLEPDTGGGWSVTGTGVARDATEAEAAELERAAIRHWASEPGHRLVAVSTDLLTGRGTVSRRPEVAPTAMAETATASAGFERIDREACLRLLAGHEVGRLVVVAGGTPSVFPVNYGLDGAEIVFRSDPGTKVDAGLRGPVCLEIDAFDRSTRSGWSVVATGRLEEVTPYDSVDSQKVRQLPVQPWVGGTKSHWLRLVPHRITGRRIRPG